MISRLVGTIKSGRVKGQSFEIRIKGEKGYPATHLDCQVFIGDKEITNEISSIVLRVKPLEVITVTMELIK